MATDADALTDRPVTGPETQTPSAPTSVTVTLPPARVAVEWADNDPEGGSGVAPADWCRGCETPIGDGDAVRKIAGRWLHDECAFAQLRAVSVDEAWLLLADEVVARPSAFRAGDVKAVMRNVVAIARRPGGVGRG